MVAYSKYHCTFHVIPVKFYPTELRDGPIFGDGVFVLDNTTKGVYTELPNVVNAKVINSAGELNGILFVAPHDGCYGRWLVSLSGEPSGD